MIVFVQVSWTPTHFVANGLDKQPRPKLPQLVETMMLQYFQSAVELSCVHNKCEFNYLCE